MKIILILFFLISIFRPLTAKPDKIRFSSNAGYNLSNPILSYVTVNAGLGLQLTYLISPRSDLINTEFAIVNNYNLFNNKNNFMHLIRFGFGFRIFLNLFKIIRPYFTHDITSQIVITTRHKKYASGFGVLLGLGIDMPLQTSKVKNPYSSVFMDLSYNASHFAYFRLGEAHIRFISFSLGYSWKL
jgi:hypothetical protein